MDILGCSPDYRPGRIIGLSEGGGGGTRREVRSAFREEVDRIARHMQERHHQRLRSRVTLIENADVLYEIGRRDELPEAGEDGFFEKNGQRYGTFYPWTKILPISYSTLRSRLMASQKQGIPGKDSRGRIRTFYSESDVREVCADLLAKRK